MDKTEDKTQDIILAVLSNDVSYIKKAIEGISAQLKEMDSNFAKRVEVELITNDHEKRIRRLETWGFMALGALAIFQIIVNYIK